MNAFIQQGHIKLIKSDSKNIYNDLYFKLKIFFFYQYSIFYLSYLSKKKNVSLLSSNHT